MTTKQKAYIALIITSIVWGTTWVVMKLGVKGMPALQLAAIRQFIGGILFIAYYGTVKKQWLPSWQHFKQLTFLAIFTFVLANGFSTWSLKYISSGLAALIGALYPLCVVLIEYFFYNSKQLKTTTIVGILLGFTGIGVVFYENAVGQHSANYFIGLTLAVVAMLSWSYSTIAIAKHKTTFNPYFGLGWQMFIGSFFMAVLSWSTGNYMGLAHIPAKAWWAIVYLISAGSILAFIAFIYSMKHLPTSIATLYAYINPIVAIVIGSWVLQEHLTIYALVGAIITITGVFMVNRSVKTQPKDIDDIEIAEKEI